MRFFSAIQNIVTRPQQYTVLNNGPTEPDDWKARLAAQLPPLHARSPFDQLISDYLTEDEKPDLSSLICECMKHGNVDVLACVLAHEDIKTLCIEGPIDERGWKTFAKAMPDSLLVEELELSEVTLDESKCKLLFNNVLIRMPALESLSLTRVMVKRDGSFDKLKCPDLPLLAKLEVWAYSNPNVSVYPLLREILKACQLRRLSIDASEAITGREHSKLANLLRDQNQMASLKLKIETQKDFQCYMPFLCGKTSLVELDLRGCRIQGRNFNHLIKALSFNQSALESLFVGNCSLDGDPRDKEMVVIDLLPLAELKGLKHLDLSGNHLQRRITLRLLVELKAAATPLVTLNLSGNLIGPPAISAIAAFLRESKTLLRLSFEPSVTQTNLRDVGVILDLVKAVKDNKSLLELQFRWDPVLDEFRASVDAYLHRNRYAPQQAFMEAAVQTAEAFVMPMLAGDLQYPQDMIGHIISQGLTEHDALTLSSINHATRASHEEFLRKAGS
ncbi:Ran GTPase-activating protein (RanGAP) involved in mRNA processing and transport [Variovorax sp. PBS-H4]|uniref:hypothetical protein n=1 Tax=Variovorax sp. PBS-H4 TaxID=434008 RepID=UPI001315CADD|nr:hypothetical protein [Variovorax sp. PBS-H4]VTU20924.1 Ran GTPase-activating protein (RanGAP) involved in mRNA processing and transport [Variovorax sp. PBS-H4]